MKVVDICRRAKVGRATFYRYCRNMDDLVAKTEREIEVELIETLSSIRDENCSSEILFKKILWFIYRHKYYYQPLTKQMNLNAVDDIFGYIRTDIQMGWRHYPEKVLERIYHVFKYEAMDIVVWWITQEDCDIDHITKYASRLSVLSDSACARYTKTAS